MMNKDHCPMRRKQTLLSPKANERRKSIIATTMHHNPKAVLPKLPDKGEGGPEDFSRGV